jgi:acetoacetyl-CoA synthetase
LLALDGYVYGGKRFDVRATVDALRTDLPSLRATVFVPYLNRDAQLPGSLQWADFVAEPGSVEFEPVPFDHPVWVLYSSGTDTDLTTAQRRALTEAYEAMRQVTASRSRGSRRSK